MKSLGCANYTLTINEITKLRKLNNSPIYRYDLLKLCNEGPEQKLNKTVYCQPAIMVTSLASLELLKKHRPDAIKSCIGTAGFSLGEITSLVFSGALPYDQGLFGYFARSLNLNLYSIEFFLNCSHRISSCSCGRNAIS